MISLNLILNWLEILSNVIGGVSITGERSSSIGKRNNIGRGIILMVK